MGAAEVIAMLIVKYGLPAAEQIWVAIRKATQGGKDPTPEEWAALRDIVDNTIEKRIAALENTIEKRLTTLVS